ncbi:ArsA family ATPase [Chloroflexus sp.]|uniref:ArsA family ATPase n=1 Tax=Chloroflexus sp. TaxID=1904827 RepID=UPI002626B6AC|nr:ArsA-related P-loop ATPase [uncultured Chloroflexus sp.]
MRTLIFSAHHQLQQSATALATACHAARRGYRTLLASSGPGHLIGHLLHQTLGSRPLELEPNLAAMEIHPHEEVARRWEQVRPSLRSGLVARLRDLGADELPAFPGIDAVAAMLVAERARQSGRFDLLILDGPSPDSLIRALTLPDVLRWAVRLIFGLDRGPGKSRASQEQAMIPAAIVAPSATAPLQELRIELEQQRARLETDSGARVRMVVLPPELRLPPLRTALTAFGLFGLASDEVIVNGLPEQVDAESRHDFSHETSRARPLLRIGQLDLTPTDRDTWALRGAALYRDGDIFVAEPPRPTSTERDLRLLIPFIDPKALDIAVASEEVVVQLGQLRRHVLLPGLVDGGRLRARVEGELLRLWVE